MYLFFFTAASLLFVHFFKCFSFLYIATRSELPEASYPKRATRSELPEVSYPKRATRSKLPEARYPKRAIINLQTACKMAESVSGPVSPSCAVCRRHISITAAGLIHQHGPLRNRCTGSHQQPGPGPGFSPLLSQQPHGPEGMRTAPLPSSQTSLDTQQCPMKCSVKILKRIPRSSREQAASKLRSCDLGRCC